MPVETKYLRLRQPVELGHRNDGWCVCWLMCGEHFLFQFFTL